MAPWLQMLGNYPVATAGLMMAPRGIGNLVTIMLCGRLSTRVDPRFWSATGLVLLCWSFWTMTGWTPDVSAHEIIMTIMMQGAGMGLVFTPLQVLAFATLAPEPAHRGRGVVQPGPQYRRGDRRVGDHVAAGAQRPGAARDDRRLGQSVQPRAAGAGLGKA